jgi:peptide-methionine (S)-S-oxide reductase
LACGTKAQDPSGSPQPEKAKTSKTAKKATALKPGSSESQAQDDTGSSTALPKSKSGSASKKAGAAKAASDTAADNSADSATDPAEGKTSADPKKKAASSKPKTEKATFGGGCFWSMEAIFERIPGVKSVVSGFAGGTTPRPTYDMVCSGLTGHAEVVQIEYDPDKISFDDLLNVFWSAHDPTTLNRQGPDEGTNYRSIILFHNEAQRDAALRSYQKLTNASVFGAPIVTQLVPLKVFYRAERYHQDYYRVHRYNEYCQTVIEPKLRKLHLIK